MATEVAALVARLEADTRDFQKGLKAAEKRLQKLDGEGKKTRKGLKQTDSATKNLTNTVKGFAAAAGVAFATRAVVNFAKASITAASDLGESVNAVEVVFGDAAEGIKSLGVDAAESVGLANAEFNTLAVGFAAFVEKIDAGGNDVVGVMKELTGRAADFASVMNIDVAEAATIFRSGLAGETEPLRKFGIDLAAVTVTQRALALGLAETSSELTEQDKIIARYDLLMEQTAKTQGDFANTSDQLANATRILTSTFTNAQAAIGDALIPAIEKLIPLAQEGIDLIIAWAIWLGQLTGAIDKVDASVRRAKLGIDDEATAIEFMFEAFRKLQLEFGGIDEKAPLGDLFANLITENALKVELLTSRFDNLAETFGLTAEDAEFMRENAEALADEFKTTEDAVLDLADRLDKDLAKAMQRIAAKEGNKLLKRTEELRDAVLDGLDPALQQLEGSLSVTADAVKRLADEQLAAIDPSFRLVSSLDSFTAAQRAHNEAVSEFGVDSAQARAAVGDLVKAELELNAAQSLFNDTFGPEAEAIFRQQAMAAGIMGDELSRWLDFLFRIGNATRNLPPVPVSSGGTGFGGIFHGGGVVPGPPGVTVPILAQGGETVRTAQQERALQGGGGVVINVNGFVGSELQLAAQIDKLLTRRSKTSKLGF